MFRCRMALVAATWLLAAGVLRADEPIFQELERNYEKALAVWTADGEPGKPKDFRNHPSLEFYPRFSAYAAQHAARPEALPALVWIVTNGQLARRKLPQAREDWKTIPQQLLAHHAADAGIAPALPWLFGEFSPDTLDDVRRVFEKVAQVNPDREARAAALYYLASILTEAPCGADREKDVKRGADLFRKILKEYGDTQVAADADGRVFEMEHLQVGQPAPEVTGDDANGVTIRLSQFKGQVVVLDFWGFW